MGLEFTLKELVEKKAPLAKVVEEVKAQMEKLAGQDEHIGPPYHYRTITAQGIASV